MFGDERMLRKKYSLQKSRLHFLVDAEASDMNSRMWGGCFCCLFGSR